MRPDHVSETRPRQEQDQQHAHRHQLRGGDEKTVISQVETLPMAGGIFFTAECRPGSAIVPPASGGSPRPEGEQESADKREKVHSGHDFSNSTLTAFPSRAGDRTHADIGFDQRLPKADRKRLCPGALASWRPDRAQTDLPGLEYQNIGGTARSVQALGTTLRTNRPGRPAAGRDSLFGCTTARCCRSSAPRPPPSPPGRPASRPATSVSMTVTTRRFLE